MDTNETPNPTQLGILSALQRGKHVYAGTVFGEEKAKRRRQGKAAKQARKANRR